MAKRTNKSQEGRIVSPSLAPFDATIEEIWVSVIINGRQANYEVSNFGRVRTLYSSSHLKCGEILRSFISKKGYHKVAISFDGKRKMYFVHRLVATAFVPNGLHLPEINHKDEDKSNNRADNLEWCSRLYNVHYGSGREKLESKLRIVVCQYDHDGNLIREWPSVKEASRSLKIDSACIVRCANGLIKTYCNSIWLYKNPTIDKEELASRVNWLSVGNNKKYGDKTMVGAYDDTGRLCKIFPSQRYAEKFGFRSSGISRSIKTGQKHLGFRWRKIE